MTSADYDLERFVDAQRDAYDTALAELRAGQKRSHWIWFVFPQIAGLGQSAMSRRFAIGSLAEARAYLAHPLLGTRLREGVAALDALPAGDIARIMGEIDAVKLRSSLTLFEGAGPSDATFAHALDRWFGGVRDPLTLRIIANEPQIR